MKAKDLDRKFDDGGEVIEHFDVSRIKKPNRDQKRVNVDFPVWMIRSLDQEAGRLGVTRQSVIKFWIAEKLKSV